MKRRSKRGVGNRGEREEKRRRRRGGREKGRGGSRRRKTQQLEEKEQFLSANRHLAATATGNGKNDLKDRNHNQEKPTR